MRYFFGFILAFVLCLFVGLVPPESVAQYGGCLDTAQTYQSKYEKNGQIKDLVCMQKALEREMMGQQQYNCSLSAQHYQTAYERHGQVSDLVCMQKALLRELR